MQCSDQPTPTADRLPGLTPAADALLQQAANWLPLHRPVARLGQLAAIDLRKCADALDRDGGPHDYSW